MRNPVPPVSAPAVPQNEKVNFVSDIEYRVEGDPQSEAVRVFARDVRTCEDVGSATIKNEVGMVPLISSETVGSCYQKRGIGRSALKMAVERYPSSQKFYYVAVAAPGAALVESLKRHVPGIKLTVLPE